MGISGAGKTTYANELVQENGWPCVRFDNHFDYKTKKFNLDSLKEAAEKSDVVVLDGFGGCIDPNFERVKQIFTEVELVFIYMDIDLLNKIQKEKQAQKEYEWYRKDLLYPDDKKNYQANVISLNSFLNGVKRITPYASTVRILRHTEGTYTDTDFYAAEESMEEAILKYIDKVSPSPEYQDVEYMGKRIRESKSLSTLTWEVITKYCNDYSNATVIDLGCFNGFFSIKMIKAGASSVKAVDENGTAVRIAKVMVHINNCPQIKVEQKVLGIETLHKEYDIVMALNMLHHVKNMKGQEAYEKLVHNIFHVAKRMVITEINEPEIVYMDSVATEFKFKKVFTEPKHMLTAYGWRYIVIYERVNK